MSQQGIINSSDISIVTVIRGWKWKRASWLSVHTNKGQYFRIKVDELVKALRQNEFDVKKPRKYCHLIVKERNYGQETCNKSTE